MSSPHVTPQHAPAHYAPPPKPPVPASAILVPILGGVIWVAVTGTLLFFGAIISMAIFGLLQEPISRPFMIVFLLLVLAYVAIYPLSLFILIFRPSFAWALQFTYYVASFIVGGFLAVAASTVGGFASAVVFVPLAVACLVCAYFSLRLWKRAPRSRTS